MNQLCKIYCKNRLVISEIRFIIFLIKNKIINLKIEEKKKINFMLRKIKIKKSLQTGTQTQRTYV